jgi:hypothetical protein
MSGTRRTALPTGSRRRTPKYKYEFLNLGGNTQVGMRTDNRTGAVQVTGKVEGKAYATVFVPPYKNDKLWDVIEKMEAVVAHMRDLIKSNEAQPEEKIATRTMTVEQFMNT